MISYVGMLAQSNLACQQLLSNACKAYAADLSEISTEYEELETKFTISSSKELLAKGSSTYKSMPIPESGHSEPLYNSNVLSHTGGSQHQSLLLSYVMIAMRHMLF